MLCERFDEGVKRLKDTKSPHDDMKENLRFKQLQLNFTKNQKNTEKKHLRLLISSISVVLVAKTSYDISVLSTMKMYSCFLFTFCTVPKKVELLKVSKVAVGTLKLFFGKSLLQSAVFQKRKFKFSEVALVAIHCNCLICCIMIA